MSSMRLTGQLDFRVAAHGEGKVIGGAGSYGSLPSMHGYTRREVLRGALQQVQGAMEAHAHVGAIEAHAHLQGIEHGTFSDHIQNGGEVLFSAATPIRTAVYANFQADAIAFDDHTFTWGDSADALAFQVAPGHADHEQLWSWPSASRERITYQAPEPLGNSAGNQETGGLQPEAVSWQRARPFISRGKISVAT